MADLAKLSDEVLVNLILKQDQELFVYLVRRYQAKLNRYAKYLGADPAQADDILQNVFIKIFTNLNNFDKNKKFSSWAYRITHNETVNFLKKEKLNLKFSLSDWLSEVIPGKVDLEQDLANQINIKNLKNNLNKLDLKYKEILILYYLEEKKYQEISDILKIPVSTVGIRLKRGKEYLKAICKKN